MATTTVPFHDERRLAVFLVDRGMPGQRSMTAIKKLRRERRERQATAWQPSLIARFHAHLLAKATAEIRRRGGETVIGGKDRDFGLRIVHRDVAARITLVRAEGWRHYSQREGAHRATLAYLFGTDDAGPWAVRVPGTVDTVGAALKWLTPAEVTKAQAAGRRVLRQGDVYAVETTKAHDGSGELPPGHEWRPGTRYLVHQPEDGRKHRPLKIGFPVRFVPQRAYEMGRSGARANGD